MKTPTHCSKPMRRSETKKGHPWWCSECGEYVERTEEKRDIEDVVKPAFTVWLGGVECKPCYIEEQVYSDKVLDPAPIYLVDSRTDVNKLAWDYALNYGESVEELKKRIIERLEQRSIHGNLITRMSSSGRLHEFRTVETKTPYTVMAAHYDMTDDEIQEAEHDLPLGLHYIWARVSKEDFEVL